MKTKDWRTAFALQALSDFSIFKRLDQIRDIPVCHKLHYLQMTTEKLSKAFSSPIHSLDPPRKTHKGFSEFLKSAKSSRRLFAQSGFINQKQYEAYVESIRPIALMAEELAPDICPPEMNPEYPWAVPTQTPGGKRLPGDEVIAPAEHLFPAFDFKRNPRFPKFFEFLGSCMKYLQEEIEGQ